MFNLTKIKTRYMYVSTFLKTYLVKKDNVLDMCHMWQSCGIVQLD